MILVGIDIGKNQHIFSIIDNQTGEILSNPSAFHNNQEGFLLLIGKLSSYAKSQLLIGMEDTGHYHFALLKYLLDRHYTVARSTQQLLTLPENFRAALRKTIPWIRLPFVMDGSCTRRTNRSSGRQRNCCTMKSRLCWIWMKSRYSLTFPDG